MKSTTSVFVCSLDTTRTRNKFNNLLSFQQSNLPYISTVLLKSNIKKEPEVQVSDAFLNLKLNNNSDENIK